jgi:hypothetical protein
MIARHFLEADDVRLNLGEHVDGALQVVFVRAVDAVLDVEGHHPQRAVGGALGPDRGVCRRRDEGCKSG